MFNSRVITKQILRIANMAWERLILGRCGIAKNCKSNRTAWEQLAVRATVFYRMNLWLFRRKQGGRCERWQSCQNIHFSKELYAIVVQLEPTSDMLASQRRLEIFVSVRNRKQNEIRYHQSAKNKDRKAYRTSARDEKHLASTVEIAVLARDRKQTRSL